jgi:hypothetical protein
MDMCDYFMDTYKWKKTTIDKIWWEVHKASLLSVKYSTKKLEFIQKMIHKKLPCNYRQHKYYKYKTNICLSCKLEVETQDHIFQCINYPEREKLRKNYKMQLGIILSNHHTSPESTLIITHNISTYLSNIESLSLHELVPDASVDLIKAYQEQCKIGWDQWLQGRITSTWGTLQNHDIAPKISGLRFDTANKGAKELILLTWAFAYDCWLTRNEIEHDTNGDPDTRKKEKLIANIQDEAKKWKDGIYEEKDD